MKNILIVVDMQKGFARYKQTQIKWWFESTYSWIALLKAVDWRKTTYQKCPQGIKI